MLARQIETAKTPVGGWTEMPDPVLANCTEPLVAGAPDLRGTWRAIDVRVNGVTAPKELPMWSHVERIEQAGNRICITSSGVIHDMYCDGTLENGVNDVAHDYVTPISVAAAYENDVHVLRPDGIPDFVVTRQMDGAVMVWSYGPTVIVRHERV
jgi:hypothetical protein